MEEQSQRSPVETAIHFEPGCDSRLFQQLYASLDQKQGFIPFLQLLAKTFNANSAALCCLNKKKMRMEYIWQYGLPEGILEWYHENNIIEGDIVHQMAVRSSPEVFQSVRPFIDQFYADKKHNFFESDLDWHDVAWALLHVEADDYLVLSLQRLSHQGEYLVDEFRQLNHLLPYLRQTAQLYHQFNRQIAVSRTLEDILDQLPYTAIVLNDQANIIHSNKVAYDLFSREKAVWKNATRLEFGQVETHNQFFRYVAEAISASMGQAEFSASTLFVERSDQPKLIVSIAPIVVQSQQRGGALVTIFDSEHRNLPDATSIGRYFGLTPAEAMLCQDLVRGLSLKEIAASRHKSEQTLRSYLKQVFNRTGLKRQGQLISVILAALMSW
ncbi:helix-turn-helix domain-containing protein [Marinobacterium jannaschii]|uniref:hypothetical protein n=1 Tax=Marinobacterium jannaschii TaxID=64970 RepID=UPI000684A637|nr:hypothetical protein [Marinobacterium jannaschii]